MMIIQIENIYYINCNMLYMYYMVVQKECLYNSLVIPNFKFYCVLTSKYIFDVAPVYA